jgi:hypothetical protein
MRNEDDGEKESKYDDDYNDNDDDDDNVSHNYELTRSYCKNV